MSEYIPGWVWALFGLGSPVQELINRWIPERLRPLFLWGIAGVIVLVVILATPLDWDAFNLQIALVYAALTSGWAMSKIIAPPVSVSTAALRSIAIAGALGALAFAFRAHAQVDTTGIVVDLVPEGGTPNTIFRSIGGFFAAQLLSFLGAALVQWIGKDRGNLFKRR
jgi:hypothetical protein